MKKISLILSAIALSVLPLPAQENEPVAAQNPQTGAVYRLPLEDRSTVVATSLSSVEARHFNALNLRNFRCWQFTTDHPSKVYAARKGSVVAADSHAVRILHADGTYAAYDDVDEVAVKVGDNVTVKTVIGRATKFAKDKWSVRFELFYYAPNPDYGQQAVGSKSKYLSNYINPVFSVKNKCKVQLIDGNAYVVSTKRRCFRSK